MNFNEYYFKESIEDWKTLVQTNPYWKAAQKVLKTIEDAGYEAIIVGGAVRDLVLGKESDDIDISTNSPMDVLEKLFKTHDIGKNKDFGVVVAVVDGYDFEIAHYRSDSYSDPEKGKGADKVELVSSYKGDASRRDLTINQLGINASGQIIDHFGGLKDLENKVVTTVGDPNLRFKEDQVRQLRSVRFSSRFDFEISPETMAALKKNAPEIAKVAPERITKELRKMAQGTGKQFARAIEIMDEVGLLEIILPEVAKLKSLEHNPDHHPEQDKEGKHTVLAHVIEALKTNEVKDDIINLSILFHDLGKAVTHTMDDEGFHRYLGHAQEADKLIDDVCKRLKFDNDTKRKIQFAAINHMKVHDLLKISNSKIAQLMDDDAFDILVKVGEADARARGHLFDKEEWQSIINKIAEIAERYKDKKARDAIKKVVNGKWIMDLKGITKPGPEVGRIINTVIDWILDDQVSLNDINKIEQYIKEL